MSNADQTMNKSSQGVMDDAEGAARTIKQESVKMKDAAKDAAGSTARESAEKVRSDASQKAGNLEHALDDVASTIGEHSDTLGHYAEEFSSKVANLNDHIKHRSVDDLATEVRTLAKDNPAMFMLGAVAVGAIAARFFQATRQSNSDTYNNDRQTSAEAVRRNSARDTRAPLYADHGNSPGATAAGGGQV